MPKIYVHEYTNKFSLKGASLKVPQAAKKTALSQHLLRPPPGPHHMGCLGIASLTSEASSEMAQEQILKCFHLGYILHRGHLLYRRLISNLILTELI